MRKEIMMKRATICNAQPFLTSDRWGGGSLFFQDPFFIFDLLVIFQHHNK
jgi:hypothetical protein